MNSLFRSNRQIYGLTRSRVGRYVSSSTSSSATPSNTFSVPTCRLWSYKTRKCKLDRVPAFYRTFTRDLHMNGCPNPGLVAMAWLQSSPNGFLSDRSSAMNLGAIRYFSLSQPRYEAPPSSKVEVMVKNIKEKQKDKENLEKVLKDAAEAPATQETEKSMATTTPKAAVVKKSLKQKIVDEIMHYYHGFRLLFIDINVCRKLLWRVLNGKSLTRREHKLLIRTTSDLFRLVPFSVFIIVPFMELLLPVAIKLFPGMLPSTFQTAKEKEVKLEKNLKVKLEMAKFLQKTLDDMTVQDKGAKSQEAKDFVDFFQNVRNIGHYASEKDILKFSKLFEDELTLDSLNRDQLIALCRVLETSTIGTNNFLRFQLRIKLRNLAADDRVIKKEGVDSLSLDELQACCRSRGMRAYGMSVEQLKVQLEEWINLSLNEKVPPSLLLLSRALMMPENAPTADKLKATISSLPDSVAIQAKAAINERDGVIDNKTKIEVIKEEVRKIKEEREEQKEVEKEEKKKKQEKAVEEILVDKAPVLSDNAILMASEKEKEITTKDIEVLSDALDEVSKVKKAFLVEKEEIKDLKEEIADYKEDVDELREVTTKEAKTEIKESIAAKLLYKKVNAMIGNLDTAMKVLENKEKKIKEAIQTLETADEATKKKDELVRVDELMIVIRKLQKVPDETRLEQISKMLIKIDNDHDGHLKVEDVLKVIETVAKEKVNLNEKQIDELLSLINKEEIIETEEKIEKALAKSIESRKVAKEEQLKALEDQRMLKLEENLSVTDEQKTKILTSETGIETKPANAQKPILKVLTKMEDRLDDNTILDASVMKTAADRKMEQILPKTGGTSALPPLPTPKAKSNVKDSKAH